MSEKSVIKYPYLPEGKTVRYVPSGYAFMDTARVWASGHSLDKAMPGAAVIVKDGKVIGIGANGSDYHDQHGCKRVELKCKSGEGYELCEGCNPKNHSEAKALGVANVWYPLRIQGADLYLWGHWWFCKPCWDKMIAAGIRDVYLMENSEVLFNKEAPGNIVGRQFES